jgi:hypothetical protein
MISAVSRFAPPRTVVICPSALIWPRVLFEGQGVASLLLPGIAQKFSLLLVRESFGRSSQTAEEVDRLAEHRESAPAPVQDLLGLNVAKVETARPGVGLRQYPLRHVVRFVLTAPYSRDT